MNAQHISNLTGPATQERDLSPGQSASSPTTAADLVLLVALEAGAILLWVLWRALGVDLTVDTGNGSRDVGVVGVAVTTALVTAAALGLRRLLRRRGLRAWTIVAVAVWLVSFLGPTAATTGDAGAALATFHLLVGAGIVVGVRALHGAARTGSGR
jgi:hypothetical protein